jgi:hypothetical protein
MRLTCTYVYDIADPRLVQFVFDTAVSEFV